MSIPNSQLHATATKIVLTKIHMNIHLRLTVGNNSRT